MTIHPSKLLMFENLKPEDLINGDKLDFFRENVLRDLGKVCAYAIMGYADWLHYTCIKYIESGGWPDLSHIEEFVIFEDDTDYKTKERIIDNIYYIVQPIIIESQYYKKVPDFNPPEVDIGAAIDWIIKHMPKENLERMQRVLGDALEIMERDFKKKKDTPYTDKLIEWTKTGLENESRKPPRT